MRRSVGWRTFNRCSTSFFLPCLSGKSTFHMISCPHEEERIDLDIEPHLTFLCVCVCVCLCVCVRERVLVVVLAK